VRTKELKKDFADQRFVRHGTIQSLTRPFNERLIAAVQAQCDFEDGDLRAICVEAQPILGSTPHWRIVVS
jgi:hypothetical protein